MQDDHQRTLFSHIQAYERDELGNAPTSSSSVDIQDHSEDLAKYLLLNGMQRLGVAVLAFPFVDASRWLRSMTTETENHILTHLVRVAPALIKHTSQPPFYINGTSNSCVYRKGDQYFVNCRVVNYTLDRERANNFILPKGVDFFQSSNVLLEMTSNFQSVMNEKVFQNDEETGPVRGLEDVRVLVTKDGKQHYIATIFHNNQLMMSHQEYDPTKDRITRAPVASPYNRRVEKNWCMFEYDDEVRFVYQWYPLQIGKVVHSKLEIVLQRDHNLSIFKRVKGSSCGVLDPVTGSLWFLVHFHTDNHFRQYYHMMVLMDPKTFAIQKVSCPFTYEMEKIEFGMGLVVEPMRIVMTHTVFDATARVTVFDRKELESILFGSNTFYDVTTK